MALFLQIFAITALVCSILAFGVSVAVLVVFLKDQKARWKILDSLPERDRIQEEGIHQWEAKIEELFDSASEHRAVFYNDLTNSLSPLGSAIMYCHQIVRCWSGL